LHERSQRGSFEAMLIESVAASATMRCRVSFPLDILAPYFRCLKRPFGLYEKDTDQWTSVQLVHVSTSPSRPGLRLHQGGYGRHEDAKHFETLPMVRFAHISVRRRLSSLIESANEDCEQRPDEGYGSEEPEAIEECQRIRLLFY
jgi:hypothetical protein